MCWYKKNLERDKKKILGLIDNVINVLKVLIFKWFEWFFDGD